MATTTVVHLIVCCVLIIFPSLPILKATDSAEPIVYRCANGSAKSTELCLKQAILKDYDTSIRPVHHHSDLTNVHLKLFPISIGVNTAMTYYGLLSWVEMIWVDEFLKWDPREFQNLQSISLTPDSIWQPDLRGFSLEGSSKGWTSSSLTTIFSNGTVNLVSSVWYRIHCDINTSKWPLDSLSCSLVLRSEAYKGSELNVSLQDHKTDELYKYFHDDQDWGLESLTATRNVSELSDTKYTFISIAYNFVIRRKTLMLWTTVVFPTIVFALTQLAIFFLDKESTVRVTMCSMAAVSHCAFFIISSKFIPVAGDTIPYIVTFYKYSLLTVLCLLVWTVAVRSVCSLTTFPYWLHVATMAVHKNRFFSYLMPFDDKLGNTTTPGTEDAANLITQAECENQQWRNMAEFFDRILFIISLLIYLFLCIVYIP